MRSKSMKAIIDHKNVEIERADYLKQASPEANLASTEEVEDFLSWVDYGCGLIVKRPRRTHASPKN